MNMGTRGPRARGQRPGKMLPALLLPATEAFPSPARQRKGLCSKEEGSAYAHSFIH